MQYDGPTWLYRIWDGDELLYVGISGSWTRRMAEHRAGKPWFPADGSVDFTEYPDRATALHAEADAIRTERPRYNIQHNGETIRLGIKLEAEADFQLSPGAILAMTAVAAGGLLLVKWAADFLANWWVQRQGVAQGVPVQVPPVQNPFTATPQSGLASVFWTAVQLAAAACDAPAMKTPGDLHAR